MKPTDILGNIKLYNADNMEVMKTFKDKQFSLAIVDPPYGINIANRTGSIGQKKGQGKLTNYEKKEWDNAVPDGNYWSELFRVSKNQIVFGGNYFTQYLPESRGWVVWDKKQPEGVSFAMAELAYTSFDISVKMFSCSRAFIGNKVANNPRKAQAFIKIHPTQKPVQLYKWLLQNYAKDGDTILDTHFGSLSIGIACHDMKFDLTAIELDKDYYEQAKQRLINHQKQLTLF